MFLKGVCFGAVRKYLYVVKGLKSNLSWTCIMSFPLFTQCFKKVSAMEPFESCLYQGKCYSFPTYIKTAPNTINFQNVYAKIWDIKQIESFIINPLPHIDAFWRLCSRGLFKNIVTKEEIAQNKQFLLLPQCFPPLAIGYPFNYRDFLYFDKICSKSSATELSYEGKG